MYLLSLLINEIHPCWINYQLSVIKLIIHFKKRILQNPKLLNSVLYKIKVFVYLSKHQYYHTLFE